MCRDPVGITNIMKTFQGFKEEKLRRKNAFVHKSDSCKECEGRRILLGFKDNKAQEGECFHAQSPANITEAKRRPFGGFEFEEAQEGKRLQERR